MSTVASSNADLTINADGSGNDIKFQSNGTEVGSINSSGTMTATAFSGDGSALTGVGGVNPNMVINGAMQVDQRNSGSAVSITADGYGNRQFAVDRFCLQKAGASQWSLQQADAGLSGFQKAIKATVTSTDTSIGSSDYAFIRYSGEGYDLDGLGWGASGASSVTLSFWVKASAAGTYCVCFSSYVDDQHHIKEFSATTSWAKKTLTFTGPSSGTFGAGTASGKFNIMFILTSGVTGTANAWASGVYHATTNQTNLAGSTGATFELTGVKLESGSSATDFQNIGYGNELQRCKRYFQKLNGELEGANGYQVSSIFWQFPVEMRAAPTITQATGSAFSSLYTTTSQRFGGIRDSGNRASIGDGSTADAEL